MITPLKISCNLCFFPKFWIVPAMIPGKVPGLWIFICAVIWRSKRILSEHQVVPKPDEVIKKINDILQDL